MDREFDVTRVISDLHIVTFIQIAEFVCLWFVWTKAITIQLRLCYVNK